MMKKIITSLIVVIFAGIVVHAPFIVGFGVILPDYSLIIKSWKEILMGLVVVLMAIEISRLRKWKLLNDQLVYIALVYSVIHVLLLPFFDTSLQSKLAGLLIDLRYILFFVVVFATVKLYPDVKSLLVKVLFGGAVFVTSFALLQVTVLPYDFLKYLGYSTDTIASYMTVDENMDYIRISSTLRGPNPLGAYMGIFLAGLTSYVLLMLNSKRNIFTIRGNKKVAYLVMGLLFVCALIALWFSYSRSALVAGLMAIALVLLCYVAVYAKRLIKPMILAGLAISVIFGGTIYAFRDTDFVSHVILHEDPNEGNDINSNDGHAESLVDGTERMLRQPWGAGIGSTGSASLMGEEGLIIENQYLYIAHEVGWLGLLIFMVLFLAVLWELWLRRSDWLARATLASGLAMAAIGMLLPVWADDTVSIIWWGLSAIVLSGGVRSKISTQKSDKIKV